MGMFCFQQSRHALWLGAALCRSCQICVFSRPGEMALTRIPCGASSTAMLLPMPTTPHLAASYGPAPGRHDCEWTLEMLTTLPPSP